MWYLRLFPFESIQSLFGKNIHTFERLVLPNHLHPDVQQERCVFRSNVNVLSGRDFIQQCVETRQSLRQVIDMDH